MYTTLNFEELAVKQLGQQTLALISTELLLSLADAIITKAYAPILILGAVGGVIIGLIVGNWDV